MAAVLRFFIRFAPLIYLVLGLGLVIGIRHLIRARGELREAVYGLERELAQRHASQAIAGLALVGIFAAAEVVLVAFLAPNLPALSLIATPTMNLLAVPTTTLVEPISGGGTPEASPSAAPSACILGQIWLTSPQAGDELRGDVAVEGTADVPNFGFYKYEFSPIGANLWSTIQASREPVRDGLLGSWNTSGITPGDYDLRLVVIDNQGQPLPACTVPVRVLQP
jgi:hypothetical protein